MTSETRTLISPSDIIGIEFRCRHCKIQVLYPLESSERPLSGGCPNCKQVWLNFTAKQDDELSVMTRFIESLKTLSSRRIAGAEVGLQIMLSTSGTSGPER